MLPYVRSFQILQLLLMQFAKDKNQIKVSRIVECKIWIEECKVWPKFDL